MIIRTMPHTVIRRFAVILLALLGIPAKEATAAGVEGDFRRDREKMVREQIETRGVRDQRVLAAMRSVPRHRFVPADQVAAAYLDTPLPIGYDQTISQPYIVALMTELARPSAGERALEIGTGSGYQAAVLAQLVDHVYTIEIVEPLARQAARNLEGEKAGNVTVRVGDGYGGWPEHAPFDVILVTAAPDHIPQPLLDQLKPGGRMVVPVGPVHAIQQLKLIEKDEAGRVRTKRIADVRFVPLKRDDPRKKP